MSSARKGASGTHLLRHVLLPDLADDPGYHGPGAPALHGRVAAVLHRHVLHRGDLLLTLPLEPSASSFLPPSSSRTHLSAPAARPCGTLAPERADHALHIFAGAWRQPRRASLETAGTRTPLCLCGKKSGKSLDAGAYVIGVFCAAPPAPGSH